MTNREIVAVYSENQRKTIISFLGNTERERERVTVCQSRWCIGYKLPPGFKELNHEMRNDLPLSQYRILNR
jgi:hypothetical protein